MLPTSAWRTNWILEGPTWISLMSLQLYFSISFGGLKTLLEISKKKIPLVWIAKKLVALSDFFPWRRNYH